MKFRDVVVLTVALAAGVVWAGAKEIRWIDGKDLPVEGRAFSETSGGDYGRLPLKYADKVTDWVRYLGQTSCGVSLRFRTDATNLCFRWTLANAPSFLDDKYMTQHAMGGIDVYEESERGCRLLKYPDGVLAGPNMAGPEAVSELKVGWTPGRTAVVYLPLRGIVKSFQVGVNAGATVGPSPHKSGRTKPVVVYGTSIVHGGCVSRPGLCFMSQASRHLDMPVVNLGFSGSAKMELVMADVVADAEASLYILDCLPNLSTAEQVKERFEPFVRRLRERRPDTPILLCEDCSVEFDRTWKGRLTNDVYRKLKAEDPVKWGNLHYFGSAEMLPHDPDLVLDYVHPNDAGAYFMGRAYADKIRTIL